VGTSVRISSFSVPTPLLAASEGGFFRAESLDVSIEKATSSTRQFDDLLAGDLHIIHTAADNVMKHVQSGGTEVCIVATLQLGLAMHLVVGREISTWEDLRGSVVGVDAADSGYAVVLYDLLARNGLPQGTYEVLAGGDTETRAAAVIEGATSACMLAHQPLREAIARGARVMTLGHDAYPWYPGLTIATTRRFITEHPDVALRYVRAMVRGCQWATTEEHLDEVVGMIAAARGLDIAASSAILLLERESARVDLPRPDELEASLRQCASLREAMTGIRTQGYADLSLYRTVIQAVSIGGSVR
jgi:ABC-type nitrate/sulfonate/bicarbonate transport system substrate-binding protein